MIAQEPEKTEELNLGAPVFSPKTFSLSSSMLPEEFEECWAVIEKDNSAYEKELRRRVESVSLQPLADPTCYYLNDLVRDNPFFIVSKGLAIKILGDVERRWLHKDSSTDENAQELRRCIISLLKPFIESVPPRMKLRVRIELWQKSQPIPDHGTAPAVAFAIDAKTGHIYRRFYGNTKYACSLIPEITIACGVTIICQPFRHGDEAWIQCQGQGGYMYSEGETMLVNERAERVNSGMLKPRPVTL